MANLEHLVKLKEGVEAWNYWRKENPEIVPDLTGANFRDADLNKANLNGAILSNANFNRANLFDTNLNNTILHNANLDRAVIKTSSLVDSDLTGASLFFANLILANLTKANLKNADLDRAQVLSTNFDSAILTGACIQDWNINSQTNLQNVKCDYIFLKKFYYKEKNEWLYNDRVPHDPDKIFAPGEFTKRYQKILETVNLYFGEGINWQVFLKSFQKLQEEERKTIAYVSKEIPIIQGIENTGDGSFIIKIGVSRYTDKGEIEKSFWQKYQPMLEAKEEQIKLLHEEIRYKRKENTELMSIIKTLAAQDKSNYEIQGDFYQTSGNVGMVHNEGNISDNSQVSGINNELTQKDSIDN